MLRTAMHAPDDPAPSPHPATPPPRPPTKSGKPRPPRKAPPSTPGKPGRKPGIPQPPAGPTEPRIPVARRRTIRGHESWDAVAPEERARRLADSLWAELYALPDLGSADAKRILDLLRDVDPAGVVASTLDSERAQRPDPAVLISTITHYAGLPVADLIAQGLALDARDAQLRAGVYVPPGAATSTAPGASQPRESASVASGSAHPPDGAQHGAYSSTHDDGATHATAHGYVDGHEDGDDHVGTGERGYTCVEASTRVDAGVSLIENAFSTAGRWERAAYRSIAQAILSAMTVDARRLAHALVEVEAEHVARAPGAADSQG